jgi:hypothetical protein
VELNKLPEKNEMKTFENVKKKRKKRKMKKKVKIREK